MALALASAPGVAGASASPADDASELESAKVLYRRGVAEFDMAEYDRAIDLWIEAYAKIQRNPSNFEILDALVYNVARAQREAYKIDRDVRRLRKARNMLERSLKMNRDDLAPEADVEKLRAELARLDSEIENARELEEEVDPGEVSRAGAEGSPQAEGQGSLAQGSAAPTDRGQDKKASPLVIAGGVSLGLGVVSMGVMGGMMVMGKNATEAVRNPDQSADARADDIRRGKLADTLTITTGVLGGILVVGGAAMLGLGLKKRRGLSSPQLSFFAAPGTAALTLKGRF